MVSCFKAARQGRPRTFPTASKKRSLEERRPWSWEISLTFLTFRTPSGVPTPSLVLTLLGRARPDSDVSMEMSAPCPPKAEENTLLTFGNAVKLGILFEDVSVSVP